MDLTKAGNRAASSQQRRKNHAPTVIAPVDSSSIISFSRPPIDTHSNRLTLPLAQYGEPPADAFTLAGWTSREEPDHWWFARKGDLVMFEPFCSSLSSPIANSDLLIFCEEKVDLPSETVEERRAKAQELIEKLKEWMKNNPDSGIVKSFHSGSLAKGTAIKSSSDVDVALYIRYTGEKKADRKLADWIADRLRRAYSQMSPDQIEPQEFSVKIRFKVADIDIDIVPVFYEDDSQDKGHLVSKRSGRLKMTSIPMHLAFIRKRKSAQPQHFARVVRILKWWVAEQKLGNSKFHFKSFMVELICAHLADAGQSFSDVPNAMSAFFNYIVQTGLKERISFTDYYPANRLPSKPGTPIQIIDPVNPENNVASQYTESDRRLIVAAAQDALDALNEARTAATKAHAVAMWQIVLGPTFKG